MGFDLAEGIRFCEANGRFIFLDIGRDRYFCLPPAAEQSFRRLAGGQRLTPSDRTVLGDLASDGVLRSSERSLVLPDGRDLPLPRRSLVYDDGQVRPGLLARALWHLASAAAELRLSPLRRVIRRLERRKRALAESREDPERAMLDIALAFRRAELFAGPLDRCLPRSIAAFETMIDLHLSASLVFAVRLRPFGAHCWVQRQHLLLNESVDEARNFTPILVI